MLSQPITVLVVEDSAVERELLLHIFSSDPEIGQVLIANNGEEAIAIACHERPDVVTMDIHMPKLDGIEATRRIMQECPVPIVIVSSSAAYNPEGEKAFQALEVGALALVHKPVWVEHADFIEQANDLVETIKLMSEVRVVRQRHLDAAPLPALPRPEAISGTVRKVVAIGASAGGPQALQKVLSGLPNDFPLPVLIVQHMTPGFIEGFAMWLQDTSGFPVHVAVEGESILAGQAYLAPDGVHMGVGSDGRIILSKEEPDDGLKPSVSHLFRAINNVYGEQAIAVLLSGMGRDGASELVALKERGALTLAQNKESAMINGMPGEAIRLGGACQVLHIQDIPGFLDELARQGKQHG